LASEAAVATDDRVIPGLYAKTIPSLDGIRAIAVGLVILYHFGFAAVPGDHGVLIFFVLSGLLITWLLLKEADRTGGVSLAQFYYRRALRILPAFYAFLGLALALLVVTKREVVWEQVWAAVLYVANYYNATHPEGTGTRALNHLWSLAIEEQFYLLWPLAFRSLRRNGARLTFALGATISAIWVYRAGLHLAGMNVRYIYSAFDTRADHLLIGCMTAVLLHGGVINSFWRRVTARAWMPLVTCVMFAASAMYGHDHLTYRHVAGYALDPVLAAVGIVQMIALGSTRLWCWLNARPVVWMGRISYSLYLYQQLGVSRFVFPTAPTVVRFPACIAVTFGLAAASHYIIERPFLRLKERAVARRPALPSVAA